MHIKETVDEQLDTELFFTKGIPENLSPEAWRAAIGERTWGLFHHVIENYPCETCRAEGMILISGIHDLVNIHLGKGVYDRAKWKQFTKLVKEAIRIDHDRGHQEHVKESAQVYKQHIQELRDAMPEAELVLTPRAEHIMESA